MQSTFREAKAFTFPALHHGRNLKKIRLSAEPAGDPDLYQEICVAAFRGKKCIADILIGLNAKGELRVLISGENYPDEHALAVYPQRRHGRMAEDWP